MKMNLKNFCATLAAHAFNDQKAFEYLRTEITGESIQLHGSYSPLLIEQKLKISYNDMRDVTQQALSLCLLIGAVLATTALNNSVPFFVLGTVFGLSSLVTLAKLPKKFDLHQVGNV